MGNGSSTNVLLFVTIPVDDRNMNKDSQIKTFRPSENWAAAMAAMTREHQGVVDHSDSSRKPGLVTLKKTLGEPGGRAECVLVGAPPAIKEDGGRGEIWV